MTEPCRPSCPGGDCANCVRFDLQAERIVCTRCGRDGHRASNCPVKVPAAAGTTKMDRRPKARVASTRPNRAPLGAAGYVPMLAALRAQPCSYDRLQAASGAGRTAVRRIVAALRHVKLVHIAAWEERHRRAWVPLFAFGAGTDVPAPATSPTGRPSLGVASAVMPRPTIGIVALAVLWRAVSDEPRSLADLMASTGLSYRPLRLLLDALRKHRMVHIAEWGERSPRGGRCAALYAAGAGRDAPKPRSLGRKEINRRYRDGALARAETLAVVRALAGTRAATNDEHGEQAA